MKMRLLAMLFAVTAILPAFGWGEDGHRIVALVAEKYLTPKAQAGVKLLLESQTMAEVSSFADRYRNIDTNTAPWHYVDIPLAASSYDKERDCTAHRGCLIEQLELFKQQVNNPKLTLSNRAFALKFIIHLVGDLHQPLHCEDNGDRGGNQLKVTLFSSGASKSAKVSNLHAAWDSGLIRHADLGNAAYVEQLTGKLQPAALTNLQAGTTMTWVLQSHELARVAYQIPANHDLDEAYYQKVKPTLDACLLRGGVRLARVLNEAFAK